MPPKRTFLATSLAIVGLLVLACGGKAEDQGQAEQAADAKAQDTEKPSLVAVPVAPRVPAVEQGDEPVVADAEDAEAAAPAEDDICAEREPPPIQGPACITASLSCGDEIVGTTVGGTTYFDGDRYIHSYCFPTTEDSHRGPDRVYAFNLPAGNEATVTLDSPCAELDLAALRWENVSRCPQGNESISECEGNKRHGGGSVSFWNDKPARYLIIVDGDGDKGAGFELKVSCRDH